MKKHKVKFTVMLSATLLAAALICLAPVVVRAQTILKPGEIVYGRFVTNPNSGPNCSTTSVWAVGQDGSNDRRLFSNGVHPRISPDGRFIMFKRFDPSALCIPFSSGAEIWIRELATGRETLITNFTQPFGTFFTPETNRADNQIMFDTQGIVCRVNLDGTNRFCNNLGLGNNLTHPSVRGGDYLTVMANERPQPLGGLYTFNYNLTNPQRIPNTSGTDESPSWSLDGQTIAYGFVPPPNDNPPFYADLYKINLDGSNKTRLTFLNGTNGGSPNGFRHSLVWTTNSIGDEFIFNVVNVNDVAGIYKIAADGSGNMTRIPTISGNTPDWVGGIVPVYSEQQVASFGGGVTNGGNFTLVDTIGQAFAGQTSTGGGYSLQSGFWSAPLTAKALFDYDGDGKTDISVFRPTDGNWYLQRSAAGFFGINFGFSTDRIVPADYDGDGKTDVAIYRPAEGIWYIANSADGTYSALRFGLAEDLPGPADYDGDSKADLAVFRPSDGTWYIQNSSDGSFTISQFGANGDLPTIGDFDGDGKADIAVYRPSDSIWYQINSSNGTFSGEQFGFSTDKITPADYDGDGKMDIGIYRPSEGIWYVKNSSNSTYHSFVFGLAADIPAPGDYDGDGKADLAVFRPSDGYWYIANSSNGTFTIFPWGQKGDIPTPHAFGN